MSYIDSNKLFKSDEIYNLEKFKAFDYENKKMITYGNNEHILVSKKALKNEEMQFLY